jgi:hypothetical protein
MGLHRITPRSLRSAFCYTLTLIFLLSLAALPQTANAQGRRYILRIQNVSRFDIHRIYVSPSDSRNWGPDLLGDDVLRSGSAFTITDIRPGEYDIRFVDEDGDACILNDIAIFRSTSWTLTTAWLLNCEIRSE